MPNERRNFDHLPKPPLGAHVVAIAYGSGRDDYLAVVLCYIPAAGSEPDKYVTWVWNSAEGCEGFAHGHYFDDYPADEGFAERAWEDFTERGKHLAIKAHRWNEEALLK